MTDWKNENTHNPSCAHFDTYLGCGQIVKKELSGRIHSCPYCGLTLDRDHNAAINIMRLGLQSLQNSGRCPSLQ
jgi:putative transposase